MSSQLRPNELALKRKQQQVGLIALVLLVVVLLLLGAVYNQAFTNRVEVSLTTDRAGLLLEPGADVSLRNVTIGKVESVTEGANGAVIKLAIDPDNAKQIASNSTAKIVSPTLLGPKYVDIVAPGDTPARALRSGDNIPASQVQIEANAAFEDLVSVLNGIQPAQLNTALGAVSQTLEDRGKQLGNYLEQANAYFAKFNESLPAMERDVAATATVTKAYASLAPDLLSVLDATTTTGATVVAKEQALNTLLESLVTTSDTTRTFLADNRVPLKQAMTLLEPGTTTMARFAPMFPCLFRSLNDYRKKVEPASGGIYPGLWVHLSVLPGADGYSNKTDLPKVAADVATCGGGPIGPNGHYTHPSYDDGSPVIDNTDAPLTLQDGSSLAAQLFGDYYEIPGVPLPSTKRSSR